LEAAERGELRFRCIPQGTLSLLVQEMATTDGEVEFWTRAGVGTFADPRFGPGTSVANTEEQLVRLTDDEHLVYHCRRPNVAIVNVGAADRYGNCYVDRNALLGDMWSAAKATKRGGGIVIVQCGRVISPDPDRCYIPGDMVDAVVVRPKDSPQVFCFPMKSPFTDILPTSTANAKRALAVSRFVNQRAKLTPVRTKEDAQLARVAAWLVARQTTDGHTVNSGVGLPEEVIRWLTLGKVMSKLKTAVESGVEGGSPLSGVLFGCAGAPTGRREAHEFFRQMEEEGIKLAIIGGLELGRNGDINASRRGPGPKGFVGPGGLTHITYGADTIVFILRMRDKKSGAWRLVNEVQEVTFSAAQALAKDQRVFYVTDFGILQLRNLDRLTLVWRMPSFSVEDIHALPVRVQVDDDVPVLDQRIVNGVNFNLIDEFSRDVAT